MDSAFVLLESVNHMSLVLREAHSRGHRVIVLNHRPLKEEGPYGVPPSHVHERVHVPSWQDGAHVLSLLDDLCSRVRIVGTYAGFEPTLPYEATLRERAGLPNNGADNVAKILDKGHVRAFLRDRGLSQLRSVLLSEAQRWQRWEFDGPAVLKPVNGTGSALCYFVSSLPELHQAIAQLRSASVNDPLMREYIVSCGEFVLEQRAEGELLSVESIVDRGHVHFIGLTSRYVLASDPVVEMGSTFPYEHPRLAEIVAKSEAIHRALGVFHGATHLEVMVPRHGPIELIDFNVRFAGVESLLCFNHAFDLRFEERLTDLACGISPDLSFLQRPHQYTAEIMVLPPPGGNTMKELVFPAEVVSKRATKEVGAGLTGRSDQLDHIGVCITTAATPQQLYAKAAEVRRKISFGGVPLGDNPNNVVACSELMS